ncbi:hypothetical protein [Gluconobacter roseus]|uniref:hypothetical protein n=1 Tax=Gluconobacter roseus TaxID=586239 RepID=UPI0038D1C1F1
MGGRSVDGTWIHSSVCVVGVADTGVSAATDSRGVQMSSAIRARRERFLYE